MRWRITVCACAPRRAASRGERALTDHVDQDDDSPVVPTQLGWDPLGGGDCQRLRLLLRVNLRLLRVLRIVLQQCLAHEDGGRGDARARRTMVILE